ncbi:hypothetical protein [Pedobacter sp. SYP-B3415]|uniref:hypothetical protein n=1 Tax=Pedobacter sp. SYP-B3415 TaxID=2496641 RepID=UPI00101DA8B3|nr:hypothetical protein [Pedobacter sp. SYP-B3415]
MSIYQASNFAAIKQTQISRRVNRSIALSILSVSLSKLSQLQLLNVFSKKARNRRAGFVEEQQFSLFDDMTIKSNLSYVDYTRSDHGTGAGGR